MFSIPVHSTRRAAAAAIGLMCIAASAKQNTAPATPETPAGSPGDFDFEHGRWRTSLRRLVDPLSGSQDWTD